ncbi:MAG: efflux RND transporter permease subunit [Phycisphaerae bacterium]|nr:efflux RND transporter permease subunit [Phycisphaerae bacterium]
MILSDAAIRNRTTVGVLIVVIIIFGVYSYVTLPRESSPDIPIPYILVSTVYEGVSPEDVESAVTIKLEKELAGLKGVKEMTSSSAEGVSTVVLEFLPDVSTDDALQYVRDKVDVARGEMPQEIEEPVITEISFADFPILIATISGPISPVRLKVIADDLEEVIESIPGVLNCNVSGALEREIRVEVDQDKLAAYGITIPEVMSLIPAENVNISAGGLETPGTKFNVRVPAEFIEPGEVNELVIALRDGRPIYLTDVAQVRDTFKDRLGFARLDGVESITLSVQKRTGENIVFVAEAAKHVLREAQKRVPRGVKIDVTLDQSKDIHMMVSDLENNMLSGLILVAAVLFLFLGWRVSIIVALAIPMSMLLSVVILQTLGYTLNMVVLFALIMALGMLVDNAIVIVENIYRHYQLTGRRIQAAKDGTAEVAWPVITSTTTTVAAFSPLIFWPGIMGGFMKYLPITLIITLISSLFVAMVISPTISSALVRGRFNKNVAAGPRAGRPNEREGWFIRGYRGFLQTALHHRFTTLTLVVLLLVGLGTLYVKKGHGVELFPDFDPYRARISIRFPQGTNIYETDRLTREIEQRIQPYADADDVEHVITNVGSGGGGGPFSGGAGPHLSSITLKFPDYDLRPRPSAEVVAGIRRELTDPAALVGTGIAGAEIRVKKDEEGPPTGAAVTIRLVGEDFKKLEEISGQAKRLIADVSGLVNLRSDLEATRPELAFHVDRRRAMLLGLNTAIIGNFLKTAVFGTKVGTYRQFNDEYDITIRLPLSQRENIDDLFRLRVPSASGQAVPLSSLGEFEYTGGFGTINRVEQKRVVTLTADAEGRLSTDVLADVQKRLEQLELPLGYEIRYAGEKEEQDKAQAFLSKAFVIALFLIVLILVAQFNTLIVPFIIMSTVILSLIGVFAGLLICEMPFGIIMTGVGVISLAGVVVNNAIVLLDYTRLLQRRGLDLIDAAVQAGATRLRPVLLTATTTILGLIPMAVGVSYNFHEMTWNTSSESSQWWSSMAIAVIFGLAFATLLTLVVLPTLYVSLIRLGQVLGLRQE